MTCKGIVITIVTTVSILQTADVQMMFPAPQPMFMMQPPPPPPMAVQVMPPPPPVGIPVPFPVPVPVVVTQRTTTTTTTKAPSNEENDGNNMMFFGGNPFAPPVIVMPIPPSNVRQVEYKDSRSDESSDGSSESSRSRVLIKKKSRHHIRRKGSRRRHHFRATDHGPKHNENHRKAFRTKRYLGPGDPDFVKPVLSYLSKRGNVKFKTRISGDDAARLMGKKNMRTDEEDEESLDSSQSQHPKQISGLRLIQSIDKSRDLGTLPDKRVSNISVSYRLY